METSDRPDVQISIGAEVHDELVDMARIHNSGAGRRLSPSDMVKELLNRRKRSVLLDEKSYELANEQGHRYGRTASDYAADCILDSLYENERFWKLRLLNTAIHRKLIHSTQ